MSSPKLIPKQVKGGPCIFRERATANQAIDVLNAFLTMNVTPTGTGNFSAGQGNATLDLSATEARLTALEAAEGITDIQAVKSQVNILFAALANASISVTCNINGTITVTLDFPGIQPQPLT